MNYNKDSFPELISQPRKVLTWSFRVLLLLIVIFVVCLPALPVALYVDGSVDGEQFVFMAVILWSIVALIIAILVRGYRKGKKSAIIQISVDRLGVHYKRIDGSVESVLYAELQHSDQPTESDVFAKKVGYGKYIRTYLTVHRSGQEQLVQFDKVDVAFGFFVQNRLALMIHFLKGIRLYQPQITIADKVYETFYITPDTLTYDRKAHTKIILYTIVFMIVIYLCIELYVWYSTGHSLIGPKH